MKKLIALLLSFLVAASIVLGGGAFLWYQPAAAIVDRTMETAESAVLYYSIVEEILGPDWLNPDRFRIGASSLANNLLSAIEQRPVKYF